VITIGAISVAGTALTKATTKVSKEKTGKKKESKRNPNINYRRINNT